MIRKTTMGIALALCLGFAIASYAGEDKKTEISSSGNVPEICQLGYVANVYEAVTFSHGMHSLMAEDCAVCHHHGEAGQTPPCTKCHATSVSEGSSTPGLKDAYHHQCVGCHKKMEMGPTTCAECHTKKVAQKAAAEKKSEKEPKMSILNALERVYEPVSFSHGRHTLVTDDCVTCHHHNQPGQTLACKECHEAPFDPKNLNMPGLKGAYHLQCMGCHQEMGGGPVGCSECHAKKTSQTTTIGKN
ncbi:MAG: cytochrome c3 family protein [Candidatus Zixiibacteriota bacterium]